MPWSFWAIVLYDIFKNQRDWHPQGAWRQHNQYRRFIVKGLSTIIIAAPLAYYFTDLWLADFAFRIEIPWWIFVLSGGIAVLLAILTISVQSIQAAVANPGDSLKNE